MKNILVVGGAGYIGAHVVRDLSEHGYQCIIYDNLSEGHREAAEAAAAGVQCVFADINDREKLNETFEKGSIDAVMHFSAFAYVGESVVNPEKYYQNNVSATITLLSAMLKYNVKKFVFSSSCAAYGNPIYTPIDEKHPQKPVNPYGATKRIVERILDDYHNAYEFNYIALRYFNAAGAHPDGTIGESHRIETHLIPLVLKTLTGERENVKIFGTDYDTPDGTCIRDYIHVCDLAEAHRAALELIANLKFEDTSYCINLGTGTGISVKEIITAAEEVTSLKVPVISAPRRPGDPPALVAANDYARSVLGFNPKYTDIREIIKTAWEWEKNRKF
jgi:UDP-glucose 4-epimerase